MSGKGPAFLGVNSRLGVAPVSMNSGISLTGELSPLKLPYSFQEGLLVI